MEKDYERIDKLTTDVELIQNLVLTRMKSLENLMLSYIDIIKRYEELFTQLIDQSTKVSESK